MVLNRFICKGLGEPRFYFPAEPPAGGGARGGGGRLAPPKELGSGSNRDLRAMRFILRMCFQRSNKCVCCSGRAGGQALLHQVFPSPGFPAPRVGGGGAGWVLTDLTRLRAKQGLFV